MINYELNDNINLLNCTPLYTLYVGDANLIDSLNTYIEDSPAYRPNSKSYGGITLGNTSFEDGNLFTKTNTHIQTLKNLILEECQNYYKLLSGYGERDAIDLEIALEGWYQTLKKGDYHEYHNHSTLTDTCFISGAYYTDPGEANMGGDFSINLNPQIFQNNESCTYKLKVKKGLLVMFPANIYHSVLPYYGDTNRNCIAFNIRRKV